MSNLPHWTLIALAIASLAACRNETATAPAAVTETPAVIGPSPTTAPASPTFDKRVLTST